MVKVFFKKKRKERAREMLKAGVDPGNSDEGNRSELFFRLWELLEDYLGKLEGDVGINNAEANRAG